MFEATFDVLEIIEAERKAGPLLGVITQLGGQTPLGLAAGLVEAGVTILGTSEKAIHRAEDRPHLRVVRSEARRLGRVA